VQCDPYFDQIGCGHPGCYPTYETPRCEKQCVDDEFWVKSKHLGVSAYEVSMEPEDLKAELYTNGPIEVAFEVFEVNHRSEIGLLCLAAISTTSSYSFSPTLVDL
jgi:cathepsin B